MANYSWEKGPLGDEIDRFLGKQARGSIMVRGLINWSRLVETLNDNRKGEELWSSLSIAQKNSYRLLSEFMNGHLQAKRPPLAVLLSLIGFPGVEDEYIERWIKTEPPYIRSRPTTAEGYYRETLVHLFRVEFLETDKYEVGNGFIHCSRQEAADFAACYRTTYLFRTLQVHDYEQPINGPDPVKASLRLSGLWPDLNLSACIEPCPWLKLHEQSNELPYYLWDVRAKRTITTDSLQHRPHYVAISHTWGRWKCGSPTRVEGVDWLVPQNERFAVKSLPDDLYNASLPSSYVWIDLFCIPQDRSHWALKEISRQAVIFESAEFAITWWNDVPDWDSLTYSISWLCFLWLKKFDFWTEEREKYTISYLLFEGIFQSFKEGVKAKDLKWLSSLWTLQEACLHPHMLLYDQKWRPLELRYSVEYTIPIHLDTLFILLETVYNSAALKAHLFKAHLLRPRGQDIDENFLIKVPNRGALNLEGLVEISLDKSMYFLSRVTREQILTLASQRYCAHGRAEAIMSVIGIHDWFKPHNESQTGALAYTNLVFRQYPYEFVQEAREKIGAIFFESIVTGTNPYLRYLDIVQLDRLQGRSIGTMLPFYPDLPERTTDLPSLQYSLSILTRHQWTDHPTTDSWRLKRDGSIEIPEAGFMGTDREEDNIVGLVYGPQLIPNGRIYLSKHQHHIHLLTWLNSFEHHWKLQAFAVCTRSDPKLSQGILLMRVGKDSKARETFVKIGVFKQMRKGPSRQASCSFPVVKVNWRVL